MSRYLSGHFIVGSGRHDVRVSVGALITAAAESAGVMLDASCGGQGLCKRCAVDLIAGQFQLADGRRLEISPDQPPRRVLGCQCRIISDGFAISVPASSLVQRGEQVLSDYEMRLSLDENPAARKLFLQLPAPSADDAESDLRRLRTAVQQAGLQMQEQLPLEVLQRLPGVLRQGRWTVTATLARVGRQWRLIDIAPGRSADDCFAAAIDIGTTTVVVALVDLAARRVVDLASGYNQQLRRGADVLSRLTYADSPQRVRELQELLVGETINRLLRVLLEANGLRPEQICYLTAAGNSIMLHLFLGLSPAGMGAVPFEPVVVSPLTISASELGILANSHAPVYCAPGVSAYVGADVVCDACISGMLNDGNARLLLDMGTNAESILCRNGELLATAAPAGPAFEGMLITCGVRASTGAVDHLTIAGDSLDVSYSVVGAVKPVGICGSGLIDFLAEAMRAGLIDRTGRFIRRDNPRLRPAARAGDGLEFVLVPRQQTAPGIGDLVVTERDIEMLLKAKAVIYASVVVLAREAELQPQQLHKFYLAGGFAKYMNLDNAITIGMLPDIPARCYELIGNGSLAGAVAVLLDQNLISLAAEAARRPRILELNRHPDFEEEFTCALMLPNLHTERFAGVIERLRGTAGAEVFCG